MKSIIFFGLLGNYLDLCPRFEDTDYQSAGRTRRKQAIVTQLVERNLPKVEVAGSSPVYRSKKKNHAIQTSKQILYGMIVFFVITGT